MKLFGNEGIFVLAGLLMTGVVVASPAPAQTPPVSITQAAPAIDKTMHPEVVLAVTPEEPMPPLPGNSVTPQQVAPTEALPATVPRAAAEEVTAQPVAGATPAELAIVKNSAMLDSLSPPAPSKRGSKKAAAAGSKGAGPSVADILKQNGSVAPQPEKYLVVKKDHNEDDFDSRLTTARLALARGRPVAALELFNVLYTSNPGDKRVLMGRAVAMQKMGQNAEALSAYEAVLNNDPKNLEALTNMLGIFKNQDQASAIEKLLQLREVYPYNADISAQLGMVYGAVGDYQKSLKYLEMADALKPGSTAVLYNKAVAYDHMGKAQQASDLYRQILVLADDGLPDQGVLVEAVKKRLATLH